MMQKIEYTNLNIALSQMVNLVKTRRSEIIEWVEAERANRPWLLYNSLDIRYSGFKIAPVDNNIYPAGFNNLTSDSLKHAAKYLAQYIAEYFNQAKTVVIIIENFTRNINYFQNVMTIKALFETIGLKVFIGSYEAKKKIELPSPNSLEIYPITKDINNYIFIDSLVKPDLVVLNNDLTLGIPNILNNIIQPIIPNIKYGWYIRSKFSHFEAYNNIVLKFAQTFLIDPWLISTYINVSEDVNFKDKIGLEHMSYKVDQVLDLIRSKYDQYSIAESPYVFIKADNGTFGMGITTIRSGQELIAINKKTRHSIHSIKHGVINKKVIIQEGIPTIKSFNNLAAEDMLYIIAGQIIGKITRYNELKNTYMNLNSKGMQLMGIDHILNFDDPIYCLQWLISQLSSLATLNEI